jgi:glutaredoxin
VNRLTLLTTRECHLCVAAREALDRVSAETGESWAEVDVADDAALARDYGDWDVDDPRLLKDLKTPPA